jgi:uncharacterized protein YbcI
MEKRGLNVPRKVALAAIDFERRRTGHGPKSLAVVLCEKTLVITLHETLSPAEKALAKSPSGAAQIQEFHRQLFRGSADSLCHEIEKITGVVVREATAEVEPASGTMVQVFSLAKGVPAGSWSGNGLGEPS